METPLRIFPRPGLDAAIQLLRNAQLPTGDLTESHVERFFFAGPSSQPTGLVGLAKFDDVALLRSLVVAEERRGMGDGQRLLAHIEDYARAEGIRTLYLLTTTAEPFFAKRGFARASREAAPAPIRSSREFAGLCPASSAFMAKQL